MNDSMRALIRHCGAEMCWTLNADSVTLVMDEGRITFYRNGWRLLKPRGERGREAILNELYWRRSAGEKEKGD